MKRDSKLMRHIFTGLLLFITSQVHAFEWSFVGKVVRAEPSYAPNLVVFQMSAGAGSCPAGQWLRYYPRGTTTAEKIASYDTAYKTIVTALVAQRSIQLYGNNASCSIEHIHIL